MEQAGVQAAFINAIMMEALDLCTSIHPRHGAKPPLEQCFRDLNNNLPGVVNCQGNGNFPTYQKSNGKEWCVDQQTGWRVSNAVDASKRCCLDSQKLPPLYFWGPQGHSEFKCKSGSEDTCDPCEDEMKICME